MTVSSKSNHQIFFQRSSFLTQGTPPLYALQIVLTNKYIVPKKRTPPRIPQYEGPSSSSSSDSIASILALLSTTGKEA